MRCSWVCTGQGQRVMAAGGDCNALKTLEWC